MSTKSIAPLRLCVLAILLLTCAIGAMAQSQATTGNIEGRVLDPKDAALPGASVTVINQQTGLAPLVPRNIRATASPRPQRFPARSFRP